MKSTEVLRKEVKQYIDQADDKSLRRVKAIFELEPEDEDETSGERNWDDLPAELQAIIERGISAGEQGKGTPHNQVVEKYSKWFRK
jgi:hypothetical protein